MVFISSLNYAWRPAFYRILIGHINIIAQILLVLKIFGFESSKFHLQIGFENYLRGCCTLYHVYYLCNLMLSKMVQNRVGKKKKEKNMECIKIALCANFEKFFFRRQTHTLIPSHCIGPGGRAPRGKEIEIDREREFLAFLSAKAAGELRVCEKTTSTCK